MTLRSSLARLSRRDPEKPTLRARLAATKAHAATVIRVGRALHKTKQKPEAPPVPRIALLNYATWLFYERRKVCTALYPNLGPRVDRFVLDVGAADRWHFPVRGGTSDHPAIASRAVRVLDGMGVDWRSDPDRDDAAEMAHGPGEAAPHGWPMVDAALTTALSDLRRLDAAFAALVVDDDRDTDDVPGYREVDEAREAVLDTLCEEAAQSLHGLKAKAAALATGGVQADVDRLSELSKSLAHDLLGSSRSLIEPRPDPIVAAIEACRTAVEEWDRLFQATGHLETDAPEREAEREAHAAYWSIWHDQVLTTVPLTSHGCRLLAQFAAEFAKSEGVEFEKDGLTVLGLIATSPAL